MVAIITSDQSNDRIDNAESKNGHHLQFKTKSTWSFTKHSSVEWRDAQQKSMLCSTRWLGWQVVEWKTRWYTASRTVLYVMSYSKQVSKVTTENLPRPPKVENTNGVKEADSTL